MIHPFIAAIAALLSLALSACGALAASEQTDSVRAGDDSKTASPPRTPGAAVRTLKLATWNLEWLHRQTGSGPVKRSDADYARLRRYADALAADVVALQEVDGVEAAARVFDPSQYELHIATQSDPQRTGFAIRRGLAFTANPDYEALDVGQVRYGADITVELRGQPVRLLSVHLKSACFDEPLSSERRDCKKLAAQLPVLEQWIDARAEEQLPAVVLGDFNRRLFAKPDEPFWRELDDGQPALSDLWSPTEGRRSSCWGGSYPDFIDHIVLNKAARQLAQEDSFELQLYDAADQEHKRVLSDHCPLALVLGEPRAGAQPSPAAAPAVPPPAVPSLEAARIKGNIGAQHRKIYHAPGCPDYARTQIDEGKGERWFDSAREAEAAGFVRSSNCR